MSRLISRAENWERVYTAFASVNFSAFDYNTVKQSLIDYIKLTFPESYNDFIESSEIISIVESFAYFAELMAYRFDMAVHENLITTAQRKDSILRLAKLVSYVANRQVPARGLVKITSVQTTETVIDADGTNLANRIIYWNDVSNSNWKNQFIQVINRTLGQEFGTVSPSDRFQLQDVLFELYTVNTTPLNVGVFPYSVVANGQNVAMELVPITHDTTLGIIERRPYNNSTFSIVYGQDGLGDSSASTGFFCFTKQGTLRRIRATFDGITPNQTYDVVVNNVNDTDVWLNNIDPETNATLDVPSFQPFRRDEVAGKSGEWVRVDVSHAQNVIFNTNPKRNKYEIETRDNNRIRLIFGDGEFADIPQGTFDIWVRTSQDQDIIIPQTSVVNQQSSLTYLDSFGRVQTLTFTFSLINSLQNGVSSEDIEHIRATAPAVYYSQDRMVNGEDYNTFMLQDSSILKLRAVNRTFAGDSKYISWHDPSTTYENVKMFGNDGAVYFEEKKDGIVTPTVNVATLIDTYVEPLLSSTDIYLQVINAGVQPSAYKRLFTPTERVRLTTALTPPPLPINVNLYYNTVSLEWFPVQSIDSPSVVLAGYGWPMNFITTPLINITQLNISETKYNIVRTSLRLIFHSPSTTFWNANGASKVVDFDSLSSANDQIFILQANINYNRNSLLLQDWVYNVLGQEVVLSGTDLGLTDEHRLSVLPIDENGDGLPDFLSTEDPIQHKGLSDIINVKQYIDLTDYSPIPPTGADITLPISYAVGYDDIIVYKQDTSEAVKGVDWNEGSGLVSNIINIPQGSILENTTILIIVNEYVYFTRTTVDDPWTLTPSSNETIELFVTDADVFAAHSMSVTYNDTGLWKRKQGRSSLNFAWFHTTPRYNLVDPAASNIIDMFIIQKGYFLNLKRWLEDSSVQQPTSPTPLDLRIAYNYLTDNKMISDTLILHPGKIKLLFGPKAHTTLQARFKVIRSSDTSLTDNQIKTIIVTTVRNFFDVTLWEFGETFYFSELSATIHAALPIEINSVTLVPVLETSHFGNLFQVLAKEDEIFYPDISISDIDIVTGYNPNVLRICN